jgi:hypothetical protein
MFGSDLAHAFLKLSLLKIQLEFFLIGGCKLFAAFFQHQFFVAKGRRL